MPLESPGIADKGTEKAPIVQSVIELGDAADLRASSEWPLAWTRDSKAIFALHYEKGASEVKGVWGPSMKGGGPPI
jgi:hypothetical protein